MITLLLGGTVACARPAADSTAHRAGVTAVIDEIKARCGHQLVIREEAAVCATF